MNRNLWSDGGYYLDNSAALCEEHHLAAERTLIDVDDLRAWSGIGTRLLPEHLDAADQYDTWGNIINADGSRSPGELFDDPGCQTALADGRVLDLFRMRYKYPRTPHLPWSPGRTSDDTVIGDLSILQAGGVVVTEKMDGECTTLYRDGIHARSLDSSHHPSRAWVKQLHGRIAHEIPPGWRVCGENMYAAHSIAYDNLPSYFLVYSVWNERNKCLNWDDTVEWSSLLGLEPVPVLYGGVWNESAIRGCHDPASERQEGYVVRTHREFTYRDFRWHVAKFVRPGHVQTDQHWMHGPVVPNRLASPAT